jgi:hypothetical protein
MLPDRRSISGILWAVFSVHRIDGYRVSPRSVDLVKGLFRNGNAK